MIKDENPYIDLMEKYNSNRRPYNRGGFSGSYGGNYRGCNRGMNFYQQQMMYNYGGYAPYQMYPGGHHYNRN